MLDELRRDMEQHLDDLLDEADKLRQALLALGADEHATPPSEHTDGSATRSRRGTPIARRVPRAAKRQGSAPTASTTPAISRTGHAGAILTTPRTASGGTKHAVLAALASGTAMTAGDVAKATGLRHPSVSTTLSRLARSGEVAKAARGYQLARLR